MKIISPNRPSMLGDLIASLPFLNWLEKQYPESYKCIYIDLKCSSIAPLLLNHPLIDKIQISEESDKLSINDKKLFDTYDLCFDPYASILKDGWFNEMGIIESTFKMSWAFGFGRIDPKQWDTLTKEEKYPRLYQWFDYKINNYICIWSSPGYSSDICNQRRSPSKRYWSELVDRLLKDGYKIAQLGMKDHELISEKVLDLRHYSLFEAIKFSCGGTSLGTDSGSMHVLGALGMKQVILSTFWRLGHIINPVALVPVNYKNNVRVLFHSININAIEYDKIIECIKNLN